MLAPERIRRWRQMSADGIREYAGFLHLRTSATSADSWLLAALSLVHEKEHEGLSERLLLR